MRDGFIRAAAVSPELRVADCAFNTQKIIEVIDAAASSGVSLLTLPELCITGYTCGDLFSQHVLLSCALDSLAAIAQATCGKNMFVFVGLPLEKDQKLFNCAAALFDGKLLGVVPKSHLPNYGEFYELRNFEPAPAGNSKITVNGSTVPFGTHLLFAAPAMPELKIAAEIEDLQRKIRILADSAQKTIDWPRFTALFDRPDPAAVPCTLPPAKVRIAVARDAAFCFTYAETLEALEENGAELCFFSPLQDAALPTDIGGLYLPGGYPELYAVQLAANIAMRAAVKTAVQSGLPTVAECGGFLYLGQTLQDADGSAYPMAGVLPGQGVRGGRLVRFGYATLTARADSMLFAAGDALPVHEFHHWDSTANGTDFTAAKANGRSWACGFANAHLYAGFPHLYWAGTPLPCRFVAAACHYKKEKP